MKHPHAILEQEIAAALPRLLTLIDRGPHSKLRGCADRGFWHYRVDKDYPSATFAQVAWPLALVGRDHPDPATGRAFTQLALDAIDWWASIQHDDGSFDEWYFHERSQVATAFTTLAVAETALLLADELARSPRRGAVLMALDRAADWLTRNRDLDVANHSAGSVAALAAVAKLHPRHGCAAECELAQLLRRQSVDGFFPEYGGADPGYSTVALTQLELARRRLPTSPGLDCAITRLIAFIAPFANPDGSFSGVAGRRATRYAWLAGLAMAAQRDRLAAFTLSKLLCGRERGTLPAPLAFDDRYFCFFAMPDAVLTERVLATTRIDLPDVGPPLTATFVEAGLAVWRSDAFHVLFGANVGGTIAVWPAEGGSLLYDDSGLAGASSTGDTFSSWRFPARFELGPDRGSSYGAFASWSRASPIARHPIAFRLFNHTLGRSLALSRWVARRAKRRYTTDASIAPLHRERSVTLVDRELRVDDRLTAAPGLHLETLQRCAGFAPIHVPSAPLWLPGFTPRLSPIGPELAHYLERERELAISTRLIREGDCITLTTTIGDEPIEQAEVSLSERE